MSSIQLKKSLNKCLTKLCGNKRANNNDYEYTPYDQTKPAIPSPIKALINQNINKLNHLNKLKKVPAKRISINEEPQFHSTQLESQFQRASSTFIQQTIVDESFESDPSLSQISDKSSCFSNSDSDLTISTQSSSDNSELFQTLFTSTVSNDSNVYICNSAYNAKFKGDISIKYTDRVYLIHANEDFALVKRVNDSLCGYIPVKYLATLDDFISKF